MSAPQRLEESLNPHAGFHFSSARLIEAGHTPYQSYDIWETPELGKLFRLDGFFMTSERDEFFYHENLVHPAAISHPAPRSALIIGGGDGGAAEELFKHPSMERIVLVELDGKVIDIAREHFFCIHRGALDDPRLELRVADGLTHVRSLAARQRERFDLILLDLTDPIGPAEALYAEPFLRDCATLLGNDGLITIHTGAPFFQPVRVAGLVATLRRLFPRVCPYFVYIPLYGSLWGMATASQTTDPARLAPDEVDQRIAIRSLEHLQHYNGATHQAQQALPNYLRQLLAP